MSARSVEEPLSGWGRHPVETCRVYRPEGVAELREVVAGAEHSLTPRGLGRSYGDAALNRDRGVVLSSRLDRMLEFDAETGALRCESAVSLADIIDVFLHRGFFFPVTPGTKFISIGGAIAADVHGKNHHHSGSMSAFVDELQLLTANGDLVTCSREANPDLFWATIGGMGLTGFIVEARLRLRPVESAYVEVHVERAANLDRILERTDTTDSEFAYGVAWIDCLARGSALGRSVLLRANHATPAELPARLRSDPLGWKPGFKPSVPFTLPNATLNRISMRAFNALIYGTQRDGSRFANCDRFFYTLDSVHGWNLVYGRRGVLQYQCALPRETARDGLVEILESLSGSGRASFLAVLKSFGAESEGLLSFPRPGFTLALDLPYTGPDLVADLHRLDRVVARCGGRVYLAKDACLEPELFAEMYPGLPRFREVKQKVDPEQRFASSQARRLGLVEAT